MVIVSQLLRRLDSDPRGFRFVPCLSVQKAAAANSDSSVTNGSFFSLKGERRYPELGDEDNIWCVLPSQGLDEILLKLTNLFPNLALSTMQETGATSLPSSHLPSSTSILETESFQLRLRTSTAKKVKAIALVQEALSRNDLRLYDYACLLDLLSRSEPPVPSNITCLFLQLDQLIPSKSQSLPPTESLSDSDLDRFVMCMDRVRPAFSLGPNGGNFTLVRACHYARRACCVPRPRRGLMSLPCVNATLLPVTSLLHGLRCVLLPTSSASAPTLALWTRPPPDWACTTLIHIQRPASDDEPVGLARIARPRLRALPPPAVLDHTRLDGRDDHLDRRLTGHAGDSSERGRQLRGSRRPGSSTTERQTAQGGHADLASRPEGGGRPVERSAGTTAERSARGVHPAGGFEGSGVRDSAEGTLTVVTVYGRGRECDAACFLTTKRSLLQVVEVHTGWVSKYHH